jgi:hypothetical protein
MFLVPFICGAGTEIHFLEKLEALELVIYHNYPLFLARLIRAGLQPQLNF